ncbi:hypothetical protein HAX54_041072 [Datura stramonium]|uniref:Uncharacterized protein n=1 Tax=Datura stramonium TaxID=4076 RepID=A0ABS8VQ69_DATST|nr:hypothetical protein [Datura stramonium]
MEMRGRENGAEKGVLAAAGSNGGAMPVFPCSGGLKNGGDCGYVLSEMGNDNGSMTLGSICFAGDGR